MKKNIIFLLSLFCSVALQAGTPHSTVHILQNTENVSPKAGNQASQSRFTNWLIEKIQKKIAAKQQRLETKKQRLEAKGKTKRVARIQKNQDELTTIGIIVMIGGLLSIAVGIVLLVLSFNTGVYSFFISLGGLGLVVGFVLLLIGLAQ